MFKEIKIGDKDVSLLANGSTPIRYRQLFHKDAITQMNKGVNADDAVEMASELAFIMAKAADKADMNTLNLDDYYEWLEQFETFDIVTASEEIFGVYVGQEVTTSTAKKNKNDKQSVN